MSARLPLLAAALGFAGLVAGCESSTPDQCLRTVIFQQCMASLPRGPEHITAAGNDWDEVVSACESAAQYQSIRKVNQIRPECRP